MKFKCIWSKTVTSITVLVLLLLGFAMYKCVTDGHYVVFALLFVIIVATMAYSPFYVEVTAEGLLIRRFFGSLLIARKDIESIGLYHVQLSIRKFGSGGFFGYLGWFSNSEIGNYFSYSTDENNQILIITPTRKYLISCENKEELLRKFR